MGNRTAVWDAVSGGTQIQVVALAQSGGVPTNQVSALSNPGWFGTYAYDAAGNVTWDGVHNYQYDAENRMVSVDGGSTASYTYDHQNRRYKKTVGMTVTHYVWQGGQVLAEHNGGTGGVITDYVYSGSRMIANVSGGTTQYFLSDRLSTRLVLDASANVIGRQAHLPFGEDFAKSGTQEKHHFTSYERDSETGSDYAVNRGYSPNVGRFQQADPYKASGYKVDPQSWNRYRYSRNDPINLIDRLGLDEEVPNTLVCSNCTVNISGRDGAGGFIDFGGEVALELPGEQDPPVPGTVPVEPIPPPPLPSMGNVQELLRNWANMRDLVLSKGDCGRKLGGFMPQLNGLMSSNNVLFIYDSTDPAVATRQLPGLSPAETAQHFFNRTGNGAYTYFEFTTDRRGRRHTSLAEMFFSASFFSSRDGEYQGTLFFHELLHASLRRNDNQLLGDLGITRQGNETSSEAIQRWLRNGCK
ncbi:MAG: RHS repeat-associated core domain-containing protein [Acidobacteriota bacterium]